MGTPSNKVLTNVDQTSIFSNEEKAQARANIDAAKNAVATQSSNGLMSASDKTKLDGIQAGAEANVQADWNQTNSAADDFIKNKPVLAAIALSGSWNDLQNIPAGLVIDALYVHTDNNFTDALKTKLEGIEAGAQVNVQSDWNQTVDTADDYIKNKPSNLVQDADYQHTDNNFTDALKTKLEGIAAGAEVNVQADWNQTNDAADDFIKNKPTVRLYSAGAGIGIDSSDNISRQVQYVTPSNTYLQIRAIIDAGDQPVLAIESGSYHNYLVCTHKSGTHIDFIGNAKPQLAGSTVDGSQGLIKVSVSDSNQWTITQLLPESFGTAGKILAVNAGANGTEWIDNSEMFLRQNTQGGTSDTKASKLVIDQDFGTVALDTGSEVDLGYLVPNAPQGATTKKILTLPNGQGNPMWSDPDTAIAYVSINDSYATVNGYREAGYEIILKVFPTVDNPLYQEFRLMQYNPDGSMEFTCVTSGYESIFAYKYMLYSNGVWQRTNTGVRSYTGIQIDGIGRNLHLNQNNFVQTNFPGGLWDATMAQNNIFYRLSGGGFAGAYYLAARYKTDGTYELGLSYSGSGTYGTITFIGTETIVALDNTVTVKQAAYIGETEYYTVSTRFGGNASTPFDPTRHKAIYYSGFANIGPASDVKIAIWNDNSTVKIGFTNIEVGKVGATN